MVVKIYGPGWCMELPGGVNRIPQVLTLAPNGAIRRDMKLHGMTCSQENRNIVDPNNSNSARITEGAEMQDGMLAYYQSQAGEADANVENKLDPNLDFRDMMKNPPGKQ
jgi:hypothetical protein